MRVGHDALQRPSQREGRRLEPGDEQCHQSVADFAVGQRFAYGRVAVTAEKIKAFAREYDPQPFHTDEEAARTDFGAYPEAQFLDDMARVTEYRCDPDLTEVLVKRSFETLLWMRSKGVRFAPIYGRQAFKVDGRFRFWGGLTVEAVGGGPGLVDALTRAARAQGVEIWYGARVAGLACDDTGVTGVTAKRLGKTVSVPARAVVLAAGGFQANPEWRARYLGPGWELAKVRGTRFNTGDVIAQALAIGAAPAGNWSGCHAVGWDRNAPEFGDLAVGDGFQKHSYPFGIMLNAEGRRFVDEGADFRNYTYAKYGRVILGQPGQFAWQVFDARVKHLLRDEYRIRQVTKRTADTLEDLVRKLDDVNAEAALAEIRAYNAAVRADVPFGPNGEYRWVEVAPPGSGARLALNSPMQDEPGGGSIGVETPDVRGEYARLTALGVEADPPMEGDGAPLLFMLRDPDGNHIAVVETPSEA